MSTEIIVALLGLAGVLLAPLIKVAAERSTAGRRTAHQLPTLMFVVGLLLLLLAAGRLWFPGRGQAIDLGSTWDVRESRIVSDITAGRPLVYAHTPIGKLRYDRVVVDDTLVRVTRVCGFSEEDISHLFTRTNLDQDEPPHYTSAIIEVYSTCRIEFTVRSTAGNTIGIELVAAPAR